MNRIYANLVPAIVLAAISMSPACSWTDRKLNLLARKAESRATLHGILIRMEPGKVCNEDASMLTFKVTRAFGILANPGDTVTIGSPGRNWSCRVDFPVGGEVIVFTEQPWGCQGPSDLHFTSLPLGNIENPTQAQVDSLNGTIGLRRPRPGAAAAPTSTAGGIQGNAWRFTFPSSYGDRCGVDGRAIPFPAR